jgi:hypothetical protein
MIFPEVSHPENPMSIAIRSLLAANALAQIASACNASHLLSTARNPRLVAS